MKKKRYTKEFKLEAVRLLESSEQTGDELAKELGVKRNQLYKWREAPESGPPPLSTYTNLSKMTSISIR